MVSSSLDFYNMSSRGKNICVRSDSQTVCLLFITKNRVLFCLENHVFFKKMLAQKGEETTQKNKAIKSQTKDGIKKLSQRVLFYPNHLVFHCQKNCKPTFFKDL